MIDSTSHHEPVRKMYIQNFLRTANDNDAHGTAIISYFTALNNARKNVNYNNQSYQSYLHYLRPDILIEDSGVFVKIKCEPFFNWIGIKNPYKPKWYQKLFVKNI